MRSGRNVSNIRVPKTSMNVPLTWWRTESLRERRKSRSNWPTSFRSRSGPQRMVITMMVTVMGCSMTTSCSGSGETWCCASFLFVIICSNRHLRLDCWRSTRYGDRSWNCGWGYYRSCWRSMWCQCQSYCWLRRCLGWPRWSRVHVAGHKINIIHRSRHGSEI